MITEAKIKSLLREYLLEREWDEQTHKLDDIFDLTFKDGRNIIGIKIVGVYSNSHTRLKEEVEAAMLESLRAGSGKIDKIYIAIPASARLAMLPPAEKFKKAGIGLFLVKENGEVEERIVAKALRPETLDLKQLEELSSLIDSLKAKVYAIEKRIEEIQFLKQRISSLESKVASINERISTVRSRPIAIPSSSSHTEEETTKERVTDITSDLPDFAKDNPWLAVLSRRGSEEES